MQFLRALPNKQGVCEWEGVVVMGGTQFGRPLSHWPLRKLSTASSTSSLGRHLMRRQLS